MASFMNKNRALIYESALYTFDFDGEYRPVLARYTPDGESVILADDCVPEFLLALDGRLYYVNTRPRRRDRKHCAGWERPSGSR